MRNDRKVDETSTDVWSKSPKMDGSMTVDLELVMSEWIPLKRSNLREQEDDELKH